MKKILVLLLAVILAFGMMAVSVSAVKSPEANGVVSGVNVAQYIFKRSSSKIGFKILKNDGEYVNRGDVICVI